MQVQQSCPLAIFSMSILLNFGMSHTMNGLTQTQNQFLVLYGFLVLVPHLNRCTLALASADGPFKSLRLHMYLSTKEAP